MAGFLSVIKTIWYGDVSDVSTKMRGSDIIEPFDPTIDADTFQNWCANCGSHEFNMAIFGHPPRHNTWVVEG